MAGPLDMTGQYNTPLNPVQADHFDQWISDVQSAQGRNLRDDMDVYDVQGFAKSLNFQHPEPGHFPDTFKKPSHPTFSDESQYHTKDALGGTWSTDKRTGQDVFTAGPQNLKNGVDRLIEYMEQADPGSVLVVNGKRIEIPDAKEKAGFEKVFQKEEAPP